MDKAEECEDDCMFYLIECVQNCQDEPCRSQCYRANVACIDACPCHKDCIDGCLNCSHPICSSTTSQPETTIAQTEVKVLVLSTQRPANEPLLLDFFGNTFQDFSFSIGNETEVFRSCSTVLKGRQWVFGGYFEKRQLSVINGCGLVREGDLPFDFFQGACGTYSINQEEQAMLCFNRKERDCYLFNGADSEFGRFEKIENSSNWSHQYTRLANYKGSPIVFGWDIRFHFRFNSFKVINSISQSWGTIRYNQSDLAKFRRLAFY